MKDKRDKKKLYVIIAAAVAAILLIVLLIVLLSRCGADTPSSDAGENTGGRNAGNTAAQTNAGEGSAEPVDPSETTGNAQTDEPAHKHAFGAWTVLTEPSCLTAGKRERVCSSCGEKQEEELAPLGHKGVNNVCVRCGKTATTEGMVFADDDENPGGIVLRSIYALTGEDVLLPDLYDGKPITRIAGNNNDNGTVKHISVPDSVKSVDGWAFAYFNKLEGVHFGKGMSWIGRAVIFYSGSVRWLTVDEDNETFHSDCNCLINTAEKSLVLGCAGSVIPDDGCVEIIANASIAHATLTNLIIPDGVKTIEDYSVNDCFELVDLYIPDSVTEIGQHAFESCKSLKTIRLPSKVTVYEPYLFRWCESLEAVVIPNGVTDTGAGCFEGCTALKSAILPEGLLCLGNYTFNECVSLESITLPSTLKILGDAFAGCTALKKLVVPESVEDVGVSAVSGCTALEEYILPTVLTTRIPYNFFGNTSSLRTVAIPKGVITIEERAFVNCTSLESVVLPQSVKYLQTNVFDGCPSLKTIYFEGSEEDWAKIKISSDNEAIENATIVFNYSR